MMYPKSVSARRPKKEKGKKAQMGGGDGMCWLCGRNGCADPLDKHHIFGGALRAKSERYGLTVYLCHSRCHESGGEAVHRNPETARRLHEYGQKKAMAENGWTEETFIRKFGRNYL